ncbi:MAG TPA: cyclopropane-fatty-acyl-phospholipid synthase family protein [Vicinamibacteria bacterium]|nr:cyclopropane-fatty-acyl-phospholipid synthase family protein [Vicinamibacteria bacterium]
MKSSLAISSNAPPRARERRGLLDRFSREAVSRSLRKLRRGRLRLVDGGQSFTFGPAVDDSGLSASVRIHDPAAYRAVATRGTIGAGESYMEGSWSADDLPTLIRILLLSDEAHFGLESGLARLAYPFELLSHVTRRNTRAGSRKNIAAHYDLGNDFYRLFLDETLAYSAAIFETEGSTLREASEAKFDAVCRKLRLSPGDHLLEIGTGWGGLAIHAAEKYGCRVTTTTISREQHQLASERVHARGLGDRVEVAMRDYRELRGSFDKLVSIEMVEAVGHHYFDTFFERCAALLRPHGAALVQSITIADQHFERHRHEVDFIKRYIFPGACIPSVTRLLDAATRASDLRLFDLEDITVHYVRTLAQWRRRFHENLDGIRALGFDDRFIRMWDFYLAYCEAGFAERYLGDVHLLFVKPEWRDVAPRS